MEYGFELIRERRIEELGSDAKLYRHVKTGAQLLSMANTDTNKVFGISFKTPPKDSTGIAHILEHSVLCGSRKYAAKDPFVQLLKGSLQTFLNAMTYPDKTVYPVASQNLNDFYNLVDVYLDAVLHPLITPETFLQEGWHYEIDDKTGILSYKGVVFNEMKGVYSSPDSLLYESSQNSLFPDTTYGLDSGGNPEVIPELDYAGFKAFHETYYHPSNARLFFWGDDDPEKRLLLSAEYLDEFEHREIDSSISPQTTFSKPVELIRPYSAGEEEKDDHHITLNWLLPEVSDLTLVMGLNILSHLLVGTPAAPLRKVLIDSGLGDDITGCGLETELRQMYFSTGLKGVKGKNVHKVAPLIERTIDETASTGFGVDLIEASMNTLEFNLRENNTGRTPRGLTVMLRALTTWLHDGNPLDIIAYESILANLKSETAKDERYFEKLLTRHFIQNRHRSTVILQPDQAHAELVASREREGLKNHQASLTEDGLAKIAAENERLIKLQNTPDTLEELAKIPTLSVVDMEKKNKPIPINTTADGGFEIIYHDLFTNNIAYLDLGFNLDVLTEEELPYLALLSQAFTDMGTDKEDFTSLIRRIGKKTGGIYPSLLLSSTRHPEKPATYLHLRGKCMADQVPAMLDIYRDILLNLNLDDRERMLQIALESMTAAESALIPSGHLVTNDRLRSQFTLSGQLVEKTSGIEFLLFLRKVIPAISENWQEISARLKGVLSKIVNRDNMHCNVTLDSANWEKIRPALNNFIGDLPSSERKRLLWNSSFSTAHEFLTAPGQVQYVGKAARIRKHGAPVAGSDLVVTRYLRTAWLWEQVRVQGGAYGAVVTLGQYSGLLSMVSYRDPQVDRTLDVYDKTAGYLKDLSVDSCDLERAIVGAIGDIDAYRLPDAKGYVSLVRHLTGKDPDELQRIRNEVLSTKPGDFNDFGDRIAAIKESGVVVILGSKEHLDASLFATEHPDVKRTELL